MSKSRNTARPERGFLLVIEGIDGTGKSTLVAHLAKVLRERGLPVLTTFEPTHGLHGKKLREMAVRGRDGVTPEEETEHFIAVRRQHVSEVINPALAEGRIVIL